jgi:hypothetical protein
MPVVCFIALIRITQRIENHERMVKKLFISYRYQTGGMASNDADAVLSAGGAQLLIATKCLAPV